MGDTVDLPEILAEHRTDDAAKLLHRYYTEKTTTGSIRTGAHFDTWAGRGDARDVVNTVTADDLLALSLLSVEVKGPAVIGLLETHAADITRLLEQIPADLDMAAVRPEDYAGMYGKDSAAWRLWEVIRGYKGGQWRMGPTKTSKLLARKRRRLIPIWDSVVARSAGLNSSLTYWEEWHRLLTADDGALAGRLERIRAAADLSVEVSALRVMDVVLWMDGKQRGYRSAADDD